MLKYITKYIDTELAFPICKATSTYKRQWEKRNWIVPTFETQAKFMNNIDILGCALQAVWRSEWR